MKQKIDGLERRLQTSYPIMVLLIASLVLLLIGLPFVRPRALSVHLNQIASETIRANKTVEDSEKTEANRVAAANAVADVYTYDETIRDKQLALVHSFFQAIRQTKARFAQQTASSSSESSNAVTAPPIEALVSDFKDSLDTTNEAIKGLAVFMPEQSLATLFAANENELLAYEETLTRILTTYLGERVQASTLDTVRKKAETELYFQNYSDAVREAMQPILNNTIVVTEAYNETATAQRKEEARQAVQPVMIVQGQVIVQEQDVITSAVLRQLELLGIHSHVSTNNLVAFASVLLLQIVVLLHFVRRSDVSQSCKNAWVNVYLFAVLSNVIGLALVQLLSQVGVEYSGLLFPIGLMIFFVVPKGTRRLGLLMTAFTLFFALILGNASGNTPQFSLSWSYYVLSGLIAFGFVREHFRQATWKMIALHVGLNIGVVTILSLIHEVAFGSPTFYVMWAYAAVSVLFTYLSLRLLHPFFDVLFSDRAVLTLVNLSNPNHPLLRELIAKAPGTYHHSLMVANLSATAVDLIGGDALFTRVACYYHDVGKIKNALFFIENVPNGMENPHELLTPEDSAQIILDHVTSGAKLLRDYQLPQEIIDICEQHHGTTLVKYFFMKAQAQNPDVREADFRYPGPKPQTKEAVVINITDTVEAATRTMKAPNRESITELVDEVIAERLQDGQFSESPINFAELRIVRDALIDGLTASYHGRVAYPQKKPAKA